MESGGTECPHCHEDAVFEDEIGSLIQKVCHSCGSVVEEECSIGVVRDMRPDGIDVNHQNLHANIPWQHRREFFKSKPTVVKSTIAYIRGLADQLHFNPIEKARSFELFERIIKFDEFKYARTEKKLGIAACSVYITMRENDKPMTKSRVCEVCEVSLANLNDVYTKVVDLLNINITTTAIEDVVPGYLGQYTLPDKDKVISKALRIIVLARKVWLTCAKKPQAVISACVFVAWMSLDIANRVSVKYDNFCRIYKLQRYQSSIIRIKELFEMMQKLAEQLPWTQKNQLKNKRYILSSIDSILRVSNVLCHLAVGSEDEEKIRDSFVQPPAKKVKLNLRGCPDLPEGSVSNSPELSKDDIPEESLHLYIRSEKEIKVLESFSDKHKR